ncbi:hypothetical protein JW859_00810 [bacterium]|nr:hypothetical protein [bacterium]
MADDIQPVATSEEELSWTVNPWRTNWRRPLTAMLVCLAVALLAGFSFNYPNYATAPQVAPGSQVDDASAEELAQLEKLAEARAHWIGQAIGWSFISFVLLISLTAMIYLPIRYQLDARGITSYLVGLPSHRPWSHYRNFYAHDTGVHVTTMPAPSALDAFRGHYLQFAGNRDEVLAFLERHMTLRGVPERQVPR